MPLAWHIGSANAAFIAFLQLHNFNNVAYMSYICLSCVAISVFFYAKI